MQRNKIILLAMLVIFIAVLLGLGAYYFSLVFPGVKTAPSANIGQKSAQKMHAPVIPSAAEQLELIKKNYPALITGTIKFFDTKNSFKTTLTTAAGVQYTLWPAQPESVYKSFGAKNNVKVQVNGKPIGDGKLEWALMKPI